MVTTIILTVASYCSGSLPSGVWLARLAGVDVQRSGSGNIGATNVARTSGWRLGALTLLCDAAKGFVPVVTAKYLISDPWGVAAVGFAAICGHIFSCFLRFRGGKGVATALGVFLVATPVELAIATLTFGVTVATSRYVSLASILATVTIPLAAIGLGDSMPNQLLGVAAAILIVWRHAQNINRLLAGQEPRFKVK
ncbi:MAG: glycerol-3-phosphate 1-O-acyltransferase PlsY [Deltaproteobacteria bacterium]|nr:glycerol-3-phosphate 1-O-acyltransferase PlsY [Deltaproteobacteria bacterium]